MCHHNPFTARWTIKGINFCLGRWEITYLEEPLTLAAADKQKDMGTYGIYSYIYPDDDVFAEGLHEDDWIITKSAWLAEVFIQNNIPIDEDHFRWFYRAVNAQDWRCGSCGGCI